MERQAAYRNGAAESESMEELEKTEEKAGKRLSPEDKNELEDGMGKDIAEPTILEQFAADKSNFEEQENCRLPKWLYKYLVFRFNLLDRVGKNTMFKENAGECF